MTTAEASLNGVWTGELHGPYGWENSGVYVLENGRILGGNDRHYSAGRYSLDGSRYEAEILVYYYGPARAIFGESCDEFRIEVAGDVEEGVISAQVRRPDRPGFTVEYRMTRRIDVPKP
jgi:hypothetical protein